MTAWFGLCAKRSHLVNSQRRFRCKEIRVQVQICASGSIWRSHFLGSFFGVLLSLFALLKEWMDVGHVATLRDHGGGHELGELFIVADSKLQVAGSQRLLLRFLASVACELQDFESQVLKHSSHEDGTSLADSLGVATLLEIPTSATDREDQTSLGRSRSHRLALTSLLTFAFLCH